MEVVSNQVQCRIENFLIIPEFEYYSKFITCLANRVCFFAHFSSISGVGPTGKRPHLQNYMDHAGGATKIQKSRAHQFSHPPFS
jgi:hypothetical protein